MPKLDKHVFGSLSSFTLSRSPAQFALTVCIDSKHFKQISNASYSETLWNIFQISNAFSSQRRFSDYVSAFRRAVLRLHIEHISIKYNIVERKGDVRQVGLVWVGSVASFNIISNSNWMLTVCLPFTNEFKNMLIFCRICECVLHFGMSLLLLSSPVNFFIHFPIPCSKNYRLSTNIIVVIDGLANGN